MDWGVLAIVGLCTYLFWRIIDSVGDRICNQLGSIYGELGSLGYKLDSIYRELGSLGYKLDKLNKLDDLDYIYDEVRWNKEFSSAAIILERLKAVESAINNLSLSR